LPEITTRLHPDLAEKLLAAGPDDARALKLVAAGRSRGPIARTAHRLPARRPAGWAPLRHERRCRPARHGCRSRPGTLIPSRGGVAERDGALTPRHRVDARGRKASAGFGGPRSNRASACVPMSAAKPLAAISPSASGPHPESPVVINPRHDLPFIRAPRRRRLASRPKADVDIEFELLCARVESP
jgi:hypothetical protein